MQTITTVLAEAQVNSKPTLSFEFFPPKTADAQVTLRETLNDLQSLNPSFVSVTYGAGGGTRELTHQLVVEIARTTSLTSMAHLSCVGHSRADIDGIVDRYLDAGVVNFLALGGDAPKSDVTDSVTQGDFRYASELVDLLRQRSGVSIGVAAHPEVHPRSPSREADRDRLADKLLHADFAITQFFFDASHYFGLVQDLAQRGITKPVIPGIMPITNSSQIIRMAELSGAAVPSKIVDGLAACGDDSAAVVDFGVETAAQLARELLDGGAPGIHLYTLNKSTSAHRVAVAVGLA